MLTVPNAIQLFLDSRAGIVADKTLRINRQYLRSLETFFRDRDIASLTTADLRAWRKTLVERPCKYGGRGRRKPIAARLSPHTVHGHIRICKQFFAWLVRESHLHTNPAARLEQIPISQSIGASKMLTDADFEKMLAASQGSQAERVRDRALLWFFRHTGARLGGAAHLTLDALELERARAVVLEKGKGGGTMRTVFLKSESLCALREWLYVRAMLYPATAHVFTTVPNQAGEGGGTPLSEKSIYMVFWRCAKRAGVNGRYNPHALRHALAKRMLRNGANLSAVSKVLGHKHIRVTHEFYGIYEDAEAQAAHAQFA